MIGGIPGIGTAFLTRPTGGFASDAPSPGISASKPTTSFAEALASLAHGTVGTLRNAESASVEALQGKGDTRAVVDAVLSAEQSLQTAVAIRDKIVSAYLEVSRMAI